MILAYGMFYVFAAFGLAYVVGHSRASLAIRNWLAGSTDDIGPFIVVRRLIVELLECPACFGFWTGVAADVLHFSPFHTPGAVALGLFTAGTNLFLAKITKLI